MAQYEFDLPTKLERDVALAGVIRTCLLLTRRTRAPELGDQRTIGMAPDSGADFDFGDGFELCA